MTVCVPEPHTIAPLLDSRVTSSVRATAGWVVTRAPARAAPASGASATPVMSFLYWCFMHGDDLTRGTGFAPLPVVLFLQGMINSSRFSSMNTLTLKDLPDDLASSGNSLLSMVMQLSMSIGVTIAGMLLGLYGQQHISADAAIAHQVFLYTYSSMAVIIALPALIFSRVPDDTTTNTVIRRRKRSES